MTTKNDDIAIKIAMWIFLALEFVGVYGITSFVLELL